MATIDDVHQAMTRTLGEINSVMARKPCARSATCRMAGSIVVNELTSALPSYEGSSPGPSSCKQAVVALGAVADTFAHSPPVDLNSMTNAFSKANAVLRIFDSAPGRAATGSGSAP